MKKDFIVPRLNTNDNEVEIVKWHVQNGAHVKVGDDLVDLGTSKAVVTVLSEHAGYFHSLHFEDAVLAVGTALCSYYSDPEELELARKSSPQTTLSIASPHPISNAGAVVTAGMNVYPLGRFSNAAVQLIEEKKLNLEQFKNSGLVTVDVVNAALGNPTPSRHTAVEGTPTVSNGSLIEAPLTPRQQKVSKAKRVEISSLATGEAGNINSSLTLYFDSAEVRARLAKERSFNGQILPLVLYELSRLLKRYAELTSYFSQDQIHYYDRVDLGVAMDLGSGLKVITLRDSDRLLPHQFFEKLTDIGMRYLNNELTVNELQGSTFTVTDLSASDILHFHPLINGRQAAILGIGGDAKLPGHPMSLTLAFDHRITSGQQVATFLGELKSRILSYAPVGVTAKPQQASAPGSSQTATPFAAGLQAHCDRCLTSAETYYEKFPDDGLMMIYLRKDGHLASICHVCASGY